MPRVKKEDSTAVETDVVDRAKYELSYILAPTIAEEDVAAAMTGIKDALEGRGAVGLSDSFPARRPLAYEMRLEAGGNRALVREGYGGTLALECLPARVADIMQDLRADQRLIRFLFTRAQKAVPVFAPRRLRSSLLRRPPGEKILQPSPQAAGEQAQTPVPAMTDEELDRTIEELIVE
jgi:ribosomal protein S6